MTKLLLHYNPAWTTSKPVPFFRYIIKLLRPLCVLCFLFLSTAALGQQVDTWLTADRAVNSAPTPNGQFQLFTPLAPADGTPVTTWYDFIDGTPQDAVQHPTPADYPQPYPLGFEHSFGSPAYLNPIGSVPRVPTLRRDDMNFNPSIEFDGSGDGQALHFRSSTREEITIFIVFHARGMGNTAETQRLLFGGDIDTYHSSTTNLSIGISDGNRFSLGRTWTPWSDFESGNIDLQGLPTIGVLIRQVDTNPFLEDEVLRTQVNGLPDINIMKNLPDIERDLYLFNRLGKHFNSNDSNRNLTGNIAEILLADGPLDANSIQRVESYLAIKYGITLNNTGQLGSTVGNQGYTYLAADGTTIWQPDPVYLYDIAGLGRDRFDDIDGGDDNTSYDDLKLRYNLHQRIAKSENSEAVVTMSTDTNFATDNLDQSRPIIDNTTANSLSVTTTSTLHNYLLWGNDHGDINQSLVELPTDYSARIGREWKIQKTVSPGGVDPIANVSVQINLSGSDILNNGNCGDVTLLIDTDGDGDFLTGTLTEILATSIDAGQNAYFDNVNFEHQDVFTIAIVDNIPPTASNPLTLTVCGVAPLPDPSVVTDEADNCAVDTVIHIGDVSDGLINPETITRTYRITDIYGNYTDVQQIIYVYLQPNVNDIPDQEACESYILPPITGTNLSGNESYYDLPGGPLGGGGTYNEGDVITSDITLYIYDETGGVSTVCFDEESFIITITPQPDAGNDANINICEGNVLTDADLFAQLGGTPDAGGTWSPAFAGAGVYTYTVTATAPCTTDATATVTVTEQPQPDAGNDANINICEGNVLTDADLFAQLGGTPDAGGTWSPAFAGAGVYTYTVTATAPCTTDATATVTVTEQPQPDAGNDANINICEGNVLTDADLFAQLGGTPDAGGTWSPAFAGAGVYTYTVTATAPCTTDATATVTVTEQPQPDAGNDANINICEGNVLTDADLFAQLGGTPDAGGTWSPAFAGAGVYTYTVTATAPCTTDATATVTVTEQPQPDAGNDANINICEGNVLTDADLFAQLGGTPDAGGTWSPAFAGAGVYTYTVTATAPCTTDATATVTVTEQPQPDAGNDANINICEGNVLTDADLFAQLGGTPDAGGTWSPAFAGAGVYTYTVTATAPCTTDATATVTVTEQPQPDAGNDANINICEGNVLTDADLFAQLGGTPDAGGTWSPAFAGAGVYTYTVTATAPCTTDATATVTVTEQPQPDAGNDANINICEGNVLTDADLFAQLGGTPDAGGTWSPAFAGAGVYTYTVTATAPCTTDATATVTVTEQPQPDAPLDVESCDAYILPALANGNYFDAPNGGGNALSVGDYINTTTTIYVFSPGNGSCTDMENSFTVTITGFEISTNVENETCWQSQDGIAHVNVFNTNLPLTVQLDSMPSTIFNQNAFSFDNLSAGNHTLTVIDQNGCQSEANFEILAGGPNLDASIEPIYLCDSGLPSNTIAVTLSDPSISNAVLYALDSTSPNDFIMTPDFEDITPGNHSLSILHTNGCLLEIPFSIDHVEPLSLSLATVYVNEITANASGGIPPYTYYFGDNPGSSSNTFTIDRSGTFQVRVVDNNGCETTETITMTLIEISVPNFFTPNNDGQNDYWRPRNMEWFPDVQTYIFDRYGRKIKIMGAMDEGWDGHYESKPLPSGDYWYIIKLNDGSDREFVGHFTLYR